MTTNGHATETYTPLESLLFFQALRAQDLAAIDYVHVSDELLALPMLRSDSSFDQTRFTPHALQTLFERLISQEARNSLDNGSTSPTPRTRKSQAPSVVLSDAAPRLLPNLLLRFYLAFRDSCIAQIKHEEDEHDRLSREIAEIQRGDWDDRFSSPARRVSTRSTPRKPGRSENDSQAPFSIHQPQTVYSQLPQPAATTSSPAAVDSQTPPTSVPVNNTPFATNLDPLASVPSATPVDPLVHSLLTTLRRKRRSTWRSSDPSPDIRPSSPVRPQPEPCSPVRKPAVAHPHVLLPTAKIAYEPLVTKDVPPKAQARTRSTTVIAATHQVKDDPTKKEDSSTPAAVSEPPETPVLSSPVTRQTRARRGTVEKDLQVVVAADTSSPWTPAVSARPARPPPDTVYAARNFSRTSAVILNQITAHRHAGPFQKPVSAKDVEGYSDMIKRPQDLRSIKAMITAGSKAVNAAVMTSVTAAAAAAAASDEQSGGGGGGASTPKEANVIALDKTPDLVPPRAIVNSAQLEKEITRVFANAVMFTPGGDGIVSDAREMANDVENMIRDWRDVERQQQVDAVGSSSAAPTRQRSQSFDVDVSSVDDAAAGPTNTAKRRRV